MLPAGTFTLHLLNEHRSLFMRVLNDDKYNAILQSARKEFITKGFKDASMRSIAANAGVGLSNIYNYFLNKDDIFLAIVKPARDALYSFIHKNHNEESIDHNRSTTFGHKEEAVEYYIYLIDTYRDELRMLLFHSQGSSLGNFREAFTDYITETSFHYMDLERKHYPDTKEISPFFMHALASWMVSVMGEIVTHDLSKEKIREFFREYFRFEFAGWRELTET